MPEDSTMDSDGDEFRQQMFGDLSIMKPGTELHPIDELCRFCMNRITEDYFEISGDNDESFELKKICELLLQKEVELGDDMVTKICLRCVNDLKVCQTMMEQLKTADHYLRAISKFSLYFKTENDFDLINKPDTQTCDVAYINIPRKALVMPLDTFMADFEGSEHYLEDIEKELEPIKFESFVGEHLPEEIYESLVLQSSEYQESSELADENNELPASYEIDHIDLHAASDFQRNEEHLKEEGERGSAQNCDGDAEESEIFSSINSVEEIDESQQIDEPQSSTLDCQEEEPCETNISASQKINMPERKSAASFIRQQRNFKFKRLPAKRGRKVIRCPNRERPLRYILPKPTFGSVMGINFVNKAEENSQKNLVCKFCSLKVENIEALTTHYAEKHEDDRYKCQQCNQHEEGFLTKSALINHIKANHRFECTECSTGFYSQARLNKHIAAKHDYSLDCKICGKKFRSPHRRKMHMYVHKTKMESEVCWFCGKTIHKKSITMHLEQHFVEKSYKCEVCQKPCRSKSALMYHRKSHIPEEDYGDYLCGICPRTFNSESRLKKHILGHTPKQLQCKHCGKKFKRTKSLELHEINRIKRGGVCPLKVIRGVPFITEEPSHPCDVCNRLFIRPENVHRHRKYHFCEGNEEIIRKLLQEPETYKCEICDRYLFSKITFQYHMSKHTGDKEPFKCDFCGKACKTHHQIAVHERTHTGERPYICRHCGRGFQELKICHAHEYTHAEERPFPCPSCKKTFKSRRQLVSHTRTHQDASLVRPYSCPHCQRQFILERDVHAHINRYHSRKKGEGLKLDYSGVSVDGGYACSECGRVFAVENYCRKHMRLVHGFRIIQEVVEVAEVEEYEDLEMYEMIIDAEKENGPEVEVQFMTEEKSVNNDSEEISA